jgi:radical S-adenosyl methionine domain-containing protein 2
VNEHVINFHITERCNYSCDFCFAKYGLEDQFRSELHNNFERTKSMLWDVYAYFRSAYPSDSLRLNIAGGEPMLLKRLPDIIEASRNIGFEVSLITNGSALTHEFLRTNANSLSVLGVSIDSFDQQINDRIGRRTAAGKCVEQRQLSELITFAKEVNPGIRIKINTVVSEHNWQDWLGSDLESISLDKWKVFRVLPNGLCGQTIEDWKFSDFVARHSRLTGFETFVEDNVDMFDSYIMIDPMGRFYQNSDYGDSYISSFPILEVGAEAAFRQVVFDRKKFEDRYIPLIELASEAA